MEVSTLFHFFVRLTFDRADCLLAKSHCRVLTSLFTLIEPFEQVIKWTNESVWSGSHVLQKLFAYFKSWCSLNTEIVVSFVERFNWMHHTCKPHSFQEYLQQWDGEKKTSCTHTKYSNLFVQWCWIYCVAWTAGFFVAILWKTCHIWIHQNMNCVIACLDKYQYQYESTAVWLHCTSVCLDLTKGIYMCEKDWSCFNHACSHTHTRALKLLRV